MDLSRPDPWLLRWWEGLDPERWPGWAFVPLWVRALIGLVVGSLVVVVTAAGAGVSPGAVASAKGWTQLQTAVSPGPRAAMAMAYDPVSRLVVSFGGYGQTAYLSQTWTFDGATWARDTASAEPPGRADAGIAYDAVHRRLVLYGGWNGRHRMGDTWLWDGATMTWTQANPTRSPGDLVYPMMFTDPINGHADLFGGFDGTIYQDHTWQWTGSNWMELHPATSATGRAAGVAAMDRASGTAVIFDGMSDLMIDDTWTFDGSTWTLASPAQQPPARSYTGNAYDPNVRGVVVFGGLGQAPSADLGDTWIWKGDHWSQLFPSTSPSRRESPGMVFDGATGQMILFGGYSTGALLNDTWAL